MTARSLYAEALPFLLSQRAGFRLIGIDRSGAMAKELIRSGRLTLVPVGRSLRLRLEDIQRVAREGITVGGQPARLRPSRKRIGTFDPGALRRLDVDAVKGGRP